MKISLVYLICALYATRTMCLEEMAPWNTFTSPTPVFKVLYSALDKSVSVGARNVFYKLSPNLNMSRQIKTGPAYDSASCPPKSLPCQNPRILTDNDAKIMVFAKDDYVVLCGSVDRGMCRLINKDLQQIVLGLDNDTTSYVAGKDTVVAFFTEDAKGHTLYVAKSYDMDDVDLSLFGYAISSRIIVTGSNRKPVFEYSHDSGQAVTALNLHIHFRTSSHTKYVYGFGHKGFSYFLFTQRLGEDVYETRLGRVCQKDERFFSYSELALRCMRESNLAYHLATTAYIGDASTTLKMNRDMDNEDKVLYVIFGRNRQGQEPLDSNGSVLCMFPMSQIRSAFSNATRDCFKGELRTRRIKTLLGGDTKCDKKSLDDEGALEEALCNPGINHYIEGRETVL